MATAKQTSFRLAGADGGPLGGDVRRATGATAAVVICHGFKGFQNWGFFPVAAERLARAGFAAVSFNFSGSGVGPDGEVFDEPERFARNTVSAQLEDLARVLQALRDGAFGFRPSALGLLGHSMGGGTAILQAARDQDIRALVTWAAVAEFGRLWNEAQRVAWRRKGHVDVVNQRTGLVLPLRTDMLDDLEHNRAALDVTAAAARVRAPWLIAHGTADETVPVDAARALASAARTGELLLIEAVGHTFGVQHPWAGSTPGFDRLLEATVAWFARALEP
jgi:pimeloyl-ACP methyl ester carboxylesterase